MLSLEGPGYIADEDDEGRGAREIGSDRSTTE